MIRHLTPIALAFLLGSCARKMPTPLDPVTGIPGSWRVGPESSITLTYANGQFQGYGGCNQYFAPVKRERGGRISVGPVGATRRACAEDAMREETEFFNRLQSVFEMNATTSRLTLSYRLQDGHLQGRTGTLVFEPER